MSLFAELKRRNVFRVAAAYLVFGWLVLQIGDVLFPALRLPGWSLTLVAVLLGIGLVVLLTFSWVYELTPEGLKREAEVNPRESVTRATGHKLNVVILVLVALAVGLLLTQRLQRDVSDEVAEDADIRAAPVTASPPRTEAEDGSPVIAVLPFDASGSDDGGFLATGLHDDLLTRLAKLDAFRVISRTSMRDYAGTTKNIRQIGEELGAGYILAGGVQSRGPRVRVNAQLVDAARDANVWAETYDLELTAENLFDLQADVARSIAARLRTALNASDVAVISSMPTQDTGAYAAYLRGMEVAQAMSMTGERLRAAIDAFEEAVRRDPNFALAWARLSVQRSRLSQALEDPAAADAAQVALTKARELQPQLPEAELARVVYLYRVQKEYLQALSALETLEGGSVLNADVLMLKAWLFRRVGRIGEAYGTALQAQKLDPRNPVPASFLIYSAFENDDCEASGWHARTALDLAPGDDEIRRSAALYELECTGDLRRADELMSGIDLREAALYTVFVARQLAEIRRDGERMLALAEVRPEGGPLTPVFELLWRADSLRVLGRDSEARSALEQAEAAFTDLEGSAAVDLPDFAAARSDYHAQWGEPQPTRRWIEIHRERFLAARKGDRADEAFNRWIYVGNLTMVGLHDAAIELLREVLDGPGGHGFRYIDSHPAVDPLRDLPAYAELRRRYGDAR